MMTGNDGATVVYVGLGSNRGDRLGFLRRAVAEIVAEGNALVAVSSVYDTEPVGVTDQPRFLNAVIAVETALDAHRFHRCMKRIEDAVGRKPAERWGPREIDLDLLMFGDERIDEPQLTIPHRHMHERRFVLAPLAEIAPDALHARLGQTIADLTRALNDPAEAHVAHGPGILIDAAQPPKESERSLNLSQHTGV